MSFITPGSPRRLSEAAALPEFEQESSSTANATKLASQIINSSGSELDTLSFSALEDAAFATSRIKRLSEFPWKQLLDLLIEPAPHNRGAAYAALLISQMSEFPWEQLLPLSAKTATQNTLAQSAMRLLEEVNTHAWKDLSIPQKHHKAFKKMLPRIVPPNGDKLLNFLSTNTDSSQNESKNEDLSQYLPPEALQKIQEGARLSALPASISGMEPCRNDTLRLVRLYFTEVLHYCGEYVEALGPTCSVVALSPEKRKALFSTLQTFAEQRVEEICQMQERDASQRDMQLLSSLPPFKTLEFHPGDFGVDSFRGGIKIAQIAQTHILQWIKDRIEPMIEERDRAIDSNLQLSRYCRIAKKLGKDISELTEEECNLPENQLLGPEKDLPSQEELAAAAKADAIFGDLMSAEPSASSKASKKGQLTGPIHATDSAKISGKGRKKKKNPAPSAAPQIVALPKKTKGQGQSSAVAEAEPLQSIIATLCQSNHPGRRFSSDFRILRWNTNDLASIRLFGESYQKYSLDELRYQRDAHNLSPIVRMLDEPELVKNYMFNSNYKDATGRIHTGKGLYTKMIDSAGNPHEGIIRMAYDQDGVVYHCMFEKMAGNVLTLADIQKPLDFTDTQLDNHGPWKNVSAFTFDIEKNKAAQSVISLQVGKGKTQATFLFYPLA